MKWLTRPSASTWFASILCVCILSACVAPEALIIQPEDSAAQQDVEDSSAAQSSDVPQPQSALITGFIEQADSEFGYQMLRPAGWASIHLGTARGYRPADTAGQPDRVLLTAVGLEALAAMAPEGPQVAPWLEFQQSASFEAWMDQREAAWQRSAQAMNLSFERQLTLPNGALYAVFLPDIEQIQLIAYIVDGEHPLVITLEGFGAYSQLDTLQEEGIYDDLVTMLQSAKAIEQNPENIDPPQAQSPDGRYTRLPDVDRIITTILGRDKRAIVDAIQWIQLPCTTARGLGGPPKCAEGQEVGTLVEVFPVMGTSGTYLTRDTVAGIKLNVADLYAVYQVPEDVNVGEGWPVGEYGIIFLNAEPVPPTITVFVTDGKLVRVTYNMGRYPEQVIADVADRLLYASEQ